MNKIIAPVVITLIVAFFTIAQAVVIMSLVFRGKSLVGFGFGIVVLVILISVLCALVVNLYKRINEIKEEDDDDLSKY